MKILSACFFICTVAFAGCDSVRRIDMKNNTADTVKITWTLNEDSLMNNPFLLSSSKKLVFRLVPPRSRAIKMSFGAGGWSPDEVQKLTGFLTSLEIESARQRIRIDSLAQLKEFLLARRRGIGGARIEISVSE